MNRSCFFTGHRALPEGSLSQIKILLKRHIKDLIENYGVDTFITGGAAGFDTLAAYGVLFMRDNYKNISLKVYVPYPSYPRMLTPEERSQYDQIQRLCNESVFICPAYSKEAMRMRNYKMVDDAEFGIAFLSNPISGAGQTVRYAGKAGRVVWNIADEI